MIYQYNTFKYFYIQDSFLTTLINSNIKNANHIFYDHKKHFKYENIVYNARPWICLFFDKKFHYLFPLTSICDHNGLVNEKRKQQMLFKTKPWNGVFIKDKNQNEYSYVVVNDYIPVPTKYLKEATNKNHFLFKNNEKHIIFFKKQLKCLNTLTIKNKIIKIFKQLLNGEIKPNQNIEKLKKICDTMK